MDKKVVNTTNNNISALQVFARVVETRILGWQLLAYTAAKYVANVTTDRLALMALNEIDEYLKRYNKL